MVCELQMLARRNLGHVAADAVIGSASGSQYGMRLAGMAPGAFRVIELRGVSTQGPVRIVARDAVESAIALAETGALRQIERLVPRVPGIVPVGCRLALLGLAVAVSAESGSGPRRACAPDSESRCARRAGCRRERHPRAPFRGRGTPHSAPRAPPARSPCEVPAKAAR